MSESQTTPPASSFSSSKSNLGAIFKASVEAYEKKTKQSLLGVTHPLTARLQACDNSPTEILKLLRDQLGQFEEYTSDDDKLISWLNPLVTVLCVSSSVTQAVVGHLVKPIRMILLRYNL